MHTWTSRANLLFSFSTSCLAFVCVLAAATEWWHGKDVDARLQIRRVENFKPVTKGNEMLVLNMELDLDTSKLFSWNTKQVFFWLQAEYATSRHENNQITFLDHIVRSTDRKVFHEEDIRNEYPIVSRGRALRGNALNVTLYWEALPKVGMIRVGNVPLVRGYELPQNYLVDAGSSAHGGHADAPGAPPRTQARTAHLSRAFETFHFHFAYLVLAGLGVPLSEDAFVVWIGATLSNGSSIYAASKAQMAACLAVVYVGVVLSDWSPSSSAWDCAWDSSDACERRS
eukprot:jgi/Pico_ML_1/55688/g1342.t1